MTQKLVFTLLMAVFLISSVFAQSSAGDASEPVTLTFCQLAADPTSYNHKMIRLTAFVTHGFEDFSLSDPNCPPLPDRFSVWLMYGGKIESNTIYCCPGEAARETRPESLEIEGVQIPIMRDLVFDRFRELLNKEPDTTIRATLTGRFFAGRRQIIGDYKTGPGFGHLGCCSLLAVEQIEAIEPHDRKDLDYTAEAGWYEKEGCNSNGVRWVRHVSVSGDEEEVKQALEEQKLADTGARLWAYSDPQRVAIESLKPFYKDVAPILHRVSSIPGRQVFRWKYGHKRVIIVVTRPYWLSFYASTNAVAWVSTMIKEVDCQ